MIPRSLSDFNSNKSESRDVLDEVTKPYSEDYFICIGFILFIIGLLSRFISDSLLFDSFYNFRRDILFTLYILVTIISAILLTLGWEVKLLKYTFFKNKRRVTVFFLEIIIFIAFVIIIFVAPLEISNLISVFRGSFVLQIITALLVLKIIEVLAEFNKVNIIYSYLKARNKTF